MSYRVTVLKHAEIDTDKIYVWLAKRSPLGADYWCRAFLDAVKSLELDAGRYGLAPEAKAVGAEVRQHFFKTHKGRRYRLLYIIEENEARVLRGRGPGQPLVRSTEIIS
ncbi:MAG: hypothetical protein WEH44_04675 [Pirellulaceae bacterium]